MKNGERSFKVRIQSTDLEVVEASIFEMHVDAMVNPANCSLMGGGGLDGAFHRLTNGRMRSEASLKGGCDVGEVRTTGSYGLLCKHVIHAVGPSYEGGEQGEAAMLRKCYKSIFKEAERLACRKIAIPALGTGIFRYPVYEATKIAIKESIVVARSGIFDRIVFPVIDNERFMAYEACLKDSSKQV